MKKIIIAITCALLGINAAAVQIDGASKALNSKTYVRQSVCALEFAPSSRLWTAVEASTDGARTFLALSYSDNGGKSWTDAAFTISDKAADLTHGTLWCAPDGALWLFFTCASEEGILYCAVCREPAAKVPVWSNPSEIGCGTVSDRPAVSGDGGWILPYSVWGRGAGVYVSSDKGASWKSSGALVAPAANAVRSCESSVLSARDGSIRMIVRGSDNVLTCEASVYTSRDKGATWDGGEKFIDNPDRRLCVTRLHDGRLLMVKNGFFDQLCYIMPYNLVCYLSDDDGATWYGEMKISSVGKATRPYAVEDASGNILIAYDNDPEKSGEVCLLNTTASAIEAVYGQIGHEDVPGKAIFKAGRCAAWNAEQLKKTFAPRKDWASETLRIGTYNIQYRTKEWTQKRLPALEKLLAEYKFDIFGSQEPFLPQIEDMLEMDFNGQRFGDVYDYVGRVVTDVDGDRGHHYNPIFYRKDRLEMLDWGLEWFTDCPGKAGFGAYSSRQCCWGHFRDRKTGKEFYCFNSHPDHLGQEAREQSSMILVDAVRRIAKGMPAFLSGDFNAREETPSYNILMECGFLDDALLSVYNPVNAEYFSMSNYKSMDTVKKEGKHIDHIFYTPNSSKVLSWELITHSWNNYFGSDHLPIICEWKIAN